MARESSAVLKNIVIEREMPRGYTWAKFRNCWTGDLSEGRFMPPEFNSRTGMDMPAAFFCTIVVYDPVSGFIEREVKFTGSDAENMAIQQGEGNILRINAEGHLYTKSIETRDGEIARTIVVLKDGMTQVLETCKQSPREPGSMSLEEAANRSMREIEPSPSAAQAASSAIKEANNEETVWPGLVEYDADTDMDDAPF